MPSGTNYVSPQNADNYLNEYHFFLQLIIRLINIVKLHRNHWDYPELLVRHKVRIDERDFPCLGNPIVCVNGIEVKYESRAPFPQESSVFIIFFF